MCWAAGMDAECCPWLTAPRVQGKLLQLALPQEVCPDRATAQRSATTGRLVISMPIEGACPEALRCASSCAKAGAPRTCLALRCSISIDWLDHASPSCCVGPAARPGCNHRHPAQRVVSSSLTGKVMRLWGDCWLMKRWDWLALRSLGGTALAATGTGRPAAQAKRQLHSTWEPARSRGAGASAATGASCRQALVHAAGAHCSDPDFLPPLQ